MLRIHENQIYKNRHTNETAKYLRTDVVMNAGRAIRIHVLFRNELEEAWDDESFLPNGVLQNA